MIVKKNRRLTIRMGQYETHEVIGEVTVDTNNDDDRRLIGESTGPVTVEDVARFLDDTLEEVLSTDVEDAHMNTDDPDSFIHAYHQQRNTHQGR